MTRSEAFAKRMKALLEEKGMSYNELAEKSNIPVRRIYRLATLGGGNPGIFTMKAVCDALGITLDEFVSGDVFKEIDAKN